MATTRSTKARIAALRPRMATIDIRDAGLKGFGVRAAPNTAPAAAVNGRDQTLPKAVTASNS
ncbi:MAG: hypothetical protein OXI95_18775 [bacterium]|nr:hypothetical protein [bacterium]